VWYGVVCDRYCHTVTLLAHVHDDLSSLLAYTQYMYTHTYTYTHTHSHTYTHTHIRTDNNT
jgi:hypothetical protein